MATAPQTIDELWPQVGPNQWGSSTIAINHGPALTTDHAAKPVQNTEAAAKPLAQQTTLPRSFYLDDAYLTPFMELDLNRSGGFAARRQLTEAMAQKVDGAVGRLNPEVVEKLHQCHDGGTIHVFENHRSYDVYRCRQSRLCPFCAREQSAKLQRKYKEVIIQSAEDYRLQFGTFTIPNVSQGTYADTVAMLWDAWGKLRRRVSMAAAKGALITIETTWNMVTEMFHPHMHVIVAVPSKFDEDFDYGAIQRDWKELSGGDGVNWQKITDRPAAEKGKIGGAVSELLKYLAKFQQKSTDGEMTGDEKVVHGGGILDMPDEAFAEWFRTHRAGAFSRRVRSYGIFYGVSSGDEEATEGEAAEEERQQPLVSFGLTSGDGDDRSWKSGARVFLIRPPKSTEAPGNDEPLGASLSEILGAIARTASKSIRIQQKVWGLFKENYLAAFSQIMGEAMPGDQSA